jgi:hypothetical protein
MNKTLLTVLMCGTWLTATAQDDPYKSFANAGVEAARSCNFLTTVSKPELLMERVFNCQKEEKDKLKALYAPLLASLSKQPAAKEAFKTLIVKINVALDGANDNAFTKGDAVLHQQWLLKVEIAEAFERFQLER